MSPSLIDDQELALAAARAGAESVADCMGKVAGADYKGEVDPVTAADRESEERILAVIHHHRPDDGILAEESGGIAPDEGRLWIVDPLDGTVNFLHGVPHVGVSVALYESGEARVGVVIDVFREEEFSASAGLGARLNGRPIGASRQRDLGAAIVATGFPYDRRQHAARYASAVGEVLRHVQGIRRMGTASIDLAWVAVGRYDAFWELKLAPWDAAAGILLIREAGGYVTDLDGNPSQPGDHVIVASNRALHNEFCAVLRRAVPGELR